MDSADSTAGRNLTVVVPVKNGRSFLTELFLCLESQTLHPSRYNVVFSDNGSSDGTAEAVNRHRGRLRCEVVDSSQLAGASHARNMGAFQAINEYVFFMDADDVISPNALEDMLSMARHDVVVVPTVVNSMRRCPPIIYRSGNEEGLAETELVTDDQRRLRAPFFYTAFMMSRATFLDLGGFNTDLLAGEDLEMSIRCFDRGMTAVRIPGAVYTYFLRDTRRGVFHTGRSSGFAAEAVRRVVGPRYRLERVPHGRILVVSLGMMLRRPRDQAQRWRALFLAGRLAGGLEGRLRPDKRIEH